MALNTIALELVPPNLDRGPQAAVEEAQKALRLAGETGLTGRIHHVLMPGIIAEDEDRPVDMETKFDVADFWDLIRPELPGVHGLCTQVTSFSGEVELRERLTRLTTSGIEGVVFVGVPRTMADGEGSGIAPTDALSMFADTVPHRGGILIPTRDGEVGRFGFKCDRGANFALTQLLYSDAIVDFLKEFAAGSDHRPDILLSFGFVPKVEATVGLIDWLIQDPGNAAVAAEQAFVKELSGMDPDPRRRATVDLYKRVIDGVGDLGFPLSIHLEATYGNSGAAFRTFAEMLDYWAPSGS